MSRTRLLDDSSIDRRPFTIDLAVDCIAFLQRQADEARKDNNGYRVPKGLILARILRAQPGFLPDDKNGRARSPGRAKKR